MAEVQRGLSLLWEEGHTFPSSLSTLALRTVHSAVAVAKMSMAVSGPGLILPGALA